MDVVEYGEQMKTVVCQGWVLFAVSGLVVFLVAALCWHMISASTGMAQYDIL